MTGVKIVHLPSSDEAALKLGRELTIEEYEEFLDYCKKGMEGQLDWDIITTCAVEQIGVKNHDSN